MFLMIVPLHMIFFFDFNLTMIMNGLNHILLNSIEKSVASYFYRCMVKVGRNTYQELYLMSKVCKILLQ